MVFRYPLFLKETSSSERIYANKYNLCMMEIHDLICKYESKSLTLPALPVGFIQFTSSDEELTNDVSHHSQQNCILPFAQSNCHAVPIKSSCLLTHPNQDVKQVYEILFDIAEIEDFQYNPGDTIGILPTNSDDEVSIVLKTTLLSELCDQKISIQLTAGSKKKLPNYLPQETTMRKCFRECLDFHAIPKKLLLRCLMDCLMDDQDKRALAILCSKEGAAEYSERIVNAGVVFLDILQSFRSWNKIPFQSLLEHLPRLLPRPYSIANSPLKDRNILKIWFSLDEPPGVTTKMLQNIIRGGNVTQLVPIYLRQSNAFSYTRNEMNDPVILIASGVGVSPFFGFLEHREEIQKLEKGAQLANAYLFFGCRHEKDSLCKDILRHHLRVGSLNDLKEAFSRDATSEHKYVQDQIKSNGVVIVGELLKGNCRTYICGSVSMVQGVRKSIQNCLVDQLAYSDADAIDFVQKLIKEKRFIEDTWI